MESTLQMDVYIGYGLSSGKKKQMGTPHFNIITK